MMFKIIVTSALAPTTPTNIDISDEEAETVRQLSAISESRKCDTEISDQTRVQIGNKSIAELVDAIQSVLGKDASTAIFIPGRKKSGADGMVTIVVESGEEIVVAPGEEKDKKETDGKEKKKEGEKKEKATFALTGSFNSAEIRHCGEPKPCDCKQVSFCTLGNNAIDQAANRMNVLVGLNWLEVDPKKNLRVKTFAEQKKKNNSFNNFNIKLASWDDTMMHGAGCDWIALPHIFSSANGIQHGTYYTTEDRPWYRPNTYTSKYVTFARGYTIEEGVPKVAIWFNSLDINASDQMYDLRTWVSDVSRQGFKINISNTHDVTVWATGVTWLSFPSGKKAIDSARFWITRTLGGGNAHSESGKIAFKGRNISQAFVGLNELKAGGVIHTRVKLRAEASKEEVKWEVQTWLYSTVAKAGGTVIVLEE